MMNYILPIMIIFSFFCAIATGNIGDLSSSVIDGGTDAVTLGIKLMGVICLWNGLCNVAEKSGLTEKLCKLLNPFLKLIFPKLKDTEAKKYIAMNITANFLGLGNAATPLGLEAMNRLQALNHTPDTATDEMIKFVVINTAAIHLVPTTVALLRKEYGSQSPTDTLIPALILSVIALSVGLIMTNLFKGIKRSRNERLK